MTTQLTAVAALVRRGGGRATVEIFDAQEPGHPIKRVFVDDMEPDDVVGPILQRALEESGIADRYVEEAIGKGNGVYHLYTDA